MTYLQDMRLYLGRIKYPEIKTSGLQCYLSVLRGLLACLRANQSFQLVQCMGYDDKYCEYFYGWYVLYETEPEYWL